VLPLQHAEFSNELVVTLYSGWIGQLVDASFARHNHEILLWFMFFLFKEFKPNKPMLGSLLKKCARKKIRYRD